MLELAAPHREKERRKVCEREWERADEVFPGTRIISARRVFPRVILAFPPRLGCPEGGDDVVVSTTYAFYC